MTELHPFLAQEHPIAFSHRGGAALWPENTMEGFQQSYQLGYRFYETDLHLTRDDQIVLVHDDTLDRTTNGSGTVGDYTAAELQSLDAGYRFQPEEDYPFRGNGLTIPTLVEVLTTWPDTFFTLELKHGGMAKPLAELINRHDLWDRVLVAGYKDGWLKEFRTETGGRVATSTSRGEIGAFWLMSRNHRGLRLAGIALQVPMYYGPMTVVDRSFVEAAHTVGKQVHAWTIDDGAEMSLLLDMGVDGIMTNRPDTLKKLLIARGAGGPWNA
ncbi:MAG: glycerophosphodiester phosphodiesterase [Acidimicrobiia bacterium]